jgi:CO/xanthine dehydrogenase FAD-binding subunit
MHPFALSKAKDLAKAVAAHAMDGQLAFIAGGTDLLGLMKDRAAHPERLLDINGLPDMGRIEALPDGGLRVGALARMSDVAADLEVRRRFPVIAESLLFAASGQLRNMATIGGNIMQRTRCAYFRDEDDLPCNKRCPGSGCSARQGLNRNHAIFGWSDACVATHPSDLAVALAALDAVVIVLGPRGRRLIEFADFHRLPGSEPERDNVLERGDLIVAIEVPPRRKVAPRTTSRSATASPMNSRWRLQRRRSRLTAGAFDPRGSPWAASHTGLGASPRRKARCAAPPWTTAMRSSRRSPSPSPMLARSSTTGSRSSLRSASLCARCKLRELAHERRRTTDLASRRASEGDRRRPIYG